MRIVIGVVVGAVLGFSYYKFVGCSSGACPITSNPWISTLYGAAMGFLISHS
jgi:F0F1-type ATP synthase assembly protein I